MPANSTQLKTALHKPYDLLLFAKEVLSPVFGNNFTLNKTPISATVLPTKSEALVIDKVTVYGNIILDDNTEVICYEIILQPTVKLEHSKVAIQQYVRKLLTAGQAALISFIAPINKNMWRLTLVAKDSFLTADGVKEKTTNAKRYTYLLGPNETCKTAAERFETLSTERQINFDALVKAFSVEKLSKAFFDEYTIHYTRFVKHLSVDTAFITSAFTGEDKAVRDFVKKLLGRIVFLYFVQKKGWLGASSKAYKDGDANFIFTLFKESGADESFYPNWLSILFFETLNQNEQQSKKRIDDNFLMPNGKAVKIPYLNGGLFDKELHDEKIITFVPTLFHNADSEDDPKHRGFLDFLNAFNFTVFEDSPDEHTVAVDPEMLGHIFENLLEDNKDKGAFYTPKEIVHYMCQESLAEYLATQLAKEYTLYKEIGNEQVELFGNDTRSGQLKMMQQLGEKALGRDDVSLIVKHKNISKLTGEQLKKIDALLDSVKICDPAIGSGAFPMGLLQEIFAIKELIAYETKQLWQPATVKENIIQKSIYGVDIEKGAVDIARLRFWLSLVVDEELPKALPNLDYKIVVGNSLVSKFENEVIDIDWNIKPKNASDVQQIINNQQTNLWLLSNKQELYFKAVGNKASLKKEIEILKTKVLINQLLLTKISFEQSNIKLGGFAPTAKDILKNTQNEIIVNGYKKTLTRLEKIAQAENPIVDFFDWKLNFPEVLNEKICKEVGFDIVIGNPPYVGEKGNKELFRDIKQGSLKDYYNAKMDLFYFFFHQSIFILKNEGNLNFITTNYFPSADGALKLRKQFYDEMQALVLINFNEFKIFDSALGQHNMITFLRKSKVEIQTKAINVNRKNETGLIILRRILEGTDDKTNYLLFNKQGVYDSDKFYIRTNQIGSERLDKIFEKIKLNSNLLGDIASINSGCDVSISRITDKHIEQFPEENYFKNTGVFVLSENEKNELTKFLTQYEISILKPYIKNSNIDKYTHTYSNEYLLYLDWSIPKTKIPNIINYLSKFKPIIDDQKFRYDEPNWPWYTLHRPREINIFENTEKIIVPYRAKTNKFALATKPTYSSRDVFFISLEKEKKPIILIETLLAILNSRIIYFWLINKGKRKGETLEMYFTPLSEIPIIKVNLETPFKFFIDSILFLKLQTFTNTLDELMAVYFEQVIDGMVYELYFPELLKTHKREIIQYLGELPAYIEGMSDDEKLSIAKKVFNRLNEKEHPVRVNLFYMNSIPEIAIIEGKN